MGADHAPTVLCVGIVTIDLVASLDAPLQPRMKQRASRISSFPGGAAATASAAIARLGVRSRLVASVGDDDRADLVRDWLADAGVDSRLLPRAGVGTATSLVTIDPQGERTIINATAPELVGAPDAADRRHLAHAMEDVAAVLADVRWPAGAQVALDAATAAGIPSVLDLDRSLRGEREAVLRLARAATHVFASEPGLQDLVGDGDIDGGLAKLASLLGGPEPGQPRGSSAVVGVTLGSEGVRWRRLEGGPDAPILTSPAPRVTAVETLGAGDVWHGVCAAALAEGASTERAIATASAAAALRCTKRGGWEILPTAAEVAQMMA